MTLVSFLVGFRLHGGIADGLIAFALIIVFSFAFEWVFITFGLFASNAQAAQGLAFLMVPLTFVSSAYVTVSSMPGWLQAFAANQPVTYMIDAVRSLTGGPAEALLSHPASYFVVRSLMWTAAIVLVFATIGVARYRLDDEKGGELERESEIEAAIEQAFSAIAEAPPEGVRSASLGGDQTTDQESGSRLTEALLSLSAMDIAITTRGGNMTTAGIKTVFHPVSDLEKAKAVYTALIGICLARFRIELPGALLHRRPLLGAAKMGVGIR